MKRFLALLLACAAGLPLLPGCAPGQPPEGRPPSICGGLPAAPPRPLWKPQDDTAEPAASPAASPQVEKALASFGLELLKKTREAGKASTFISPVSVAAALSMAANGADGGTLAQFEEVLGGGADLMELNAAFAQFMFDYQGLSGSSQCRFANSLWKDASASLQKGFVDQCRNYYGVQMYEAELSDHRIVEDVNAWASEKTQGLIPQIIDQPFEPDVHLVLVNALYLKNAWLHAFDPLDTREADFQHMDAFTSRVEFLQHFDTDLAYIQGENAQGAVLPYDDGRLAFFALMPDLYPDSPSLGRWLNALDGPRLAQLLNSRESALFHRFAMPKFTVEWKGNMEEILPQLGIEQAFDPEKADFSRTGDNPEGCYISQVVHAAKLEVNEKGTEAAAVTAIAEPKAGPGEPPEGITLVLDRPFLYGIIDLDTGAPLFLGTYE